MHDTPLVAQALLARFARIEVLVLDDSLLAPMKDSELRDLLEILAVDIRPEKDSSSHVRDRAVAAKK